MPRPKGRIKTARVTVNLDDRAYAFLLTIAGSEDVPVGQVARRAVMDYLARQEPFLKQPNPTAGPLDSKTSGGKR